MPEAGAIVDVFKLPEDWNILGYGNNRYQVGLKNDYVVIDTTFDILTVLIYSAKVDMRHITELASWTHVRRVKINGHDGFVHMHPEGFRKLLTWHCDKSNRTYLIHFSKEQDILVRVFRKTNCH